MHRVEAGQFGRGLIGCCGELAGVELECAVEERGGGAVVPVGVARRREAAVGDAFDHLALGIGAAGPREGLEECVEHAQIGGEDADDLLSALADLDGGVVVGGVGQDIGVGL